MTVRERLLNAIKGKEVDRVPWAPFLAYYFDHLPKEVRDRGPFEYLKNMGADPLFRGCRPTYKILLNNCDKTVKSVGLNRFTTYETKVGKLVTEHTFSKTANSWFLTGHPVKSEEDFKVLQYIFENMTVEENVTGFEEFNKTIGEDGLPVTIIGVGNKTSFQSLVERWCGTVDLVYALADFPEVVEECLAVMQARDMETVKIAAKTSAEAFIFMEDSSTTNISPAFFEDYTAPEINEWGKYIHSNGKLLIHHACGHIKDLIPLMCNTEIDMIESISPPPTGNIEIADATKLMPDNIGIIGGIEPTFIKNCTLDELEKYVLKLLDVMKGKRFILANSDSCPPYVEYEKFLLVSELVRKY